MADALAHAVAELLQAVDQKARAFLGGLPVAQLHALGFAEAYRRDAHRVAVGHLAKTFGARDTGEADGQPHRLALQVLGELHASTLAAFFTGAQIAT